MKEQKFKIFTVGHSNQTIESFLSEIKSFGINCIVDVRSVPYSKYCPQFNANNLKTALNENHIMHVPFGNEFGARRTDSVGVNHQVDFELAARSKAFLRGVEQMESGLKQGGLTIALMCVEADPLRCHRFAFLARYFYERGYDVQHILKENQKKSHKELQDEMIDTYIKKKKLQPLNPGYTEQDQIRDAYHLKNLDVGYKFVGK